MGSSQSKIPPGSTEPALRFKGDSYRPRNREDSLLFQIIRDYWKTFEEMTDAEGNGLPRFVREEFEAFFRCGIIQHGFVRLKCDSCRHEKLVGFSCKKRGFCSSCIGRHMAETAAKLNDFVLPEIPYRQWVISFPIPLRLLMARKPDVLSAILHVYTSEVARMIRRKGRASLGNFEVPLDRFQTGAYTAIQRFGSALSLNIHFHSLFFEGAYLTCETEKRKPEFFTMKAPSNEEMAKLLLKIVEKIKAYLITAGFMNSEGDLLLDEGESEGILSKLQLASAQNLIATGERSGKRVRLIKNELLLKDIKISSSRCVEVFGFSLHANVDIGAKSREELEKLIRYFTRPPVAEQRLHRLENSEIFLEFKNSWSDGTIGIKFTAVEFLEKLAALVPLPRRHLFRYHGLLAPNSKYRPQIIRNQDSPPEIQASPKQSKRNSRISWSDLLKRVFQIDLSHCPDCGGTVKFVSAIMKKDVIKTILDHLRLPIEAPRFVPARVPP